MFTVYPQAVRPARNGATSVTILGRYAVEEGPDVVASHDDLGRAKKDASGRSGVTSVWDRRAEKRLVIFCDGREL